MRVSGISQRGYRSATWPELDGTRLDSFDLLAITRRVIVMMVLGCALSARRGVKILSCEREVAD